MPTPSVYDLIGQGYAHQRHADPRIAAAILAAVADAGSVLNVGAGAGSYEPGDRPVVALDPSAVMLAQRPRRSAPAVLGRAEDLPFADAAFDAVLGVLTLHHWSDRVRGLRECARVARKRVVLLTFDPAADGFWLTREYVPELIALDREQFPALDTLAAELGSDVRVETRPVPVPRDCIDGFLGAFWARPAAYLDVGVRSGISSFARRGVEGGVEAGLARLRVDLADGTWTDRYGHLLALDSLDIGYRLLVAHRPSYGSSA